MDITKTLYVADRKKWRAWLQKHHRSEPEIWLVYYKQGSGRARIPYNDAVDEALCFGWIDSTTKPIDGDRWTQRFTPRRRGSKLSAMNRVRVERLIEQGRMTPAGLAALGDALGSAGDGRSADSACARPLKIPPNIRRALRRDKATWANFEAFPESYKRIRIGWIDAARHRPEVFEQRLRYFLRMTAQNKRYGMVQ